MRVAVSVRLRRTLVCVAPVLCLAAAAQAQGPSGPADSPAPDQSRRTDRGDPTPVETSMVGIDDAFTTGRALSELQVTFAHSTALRSYRSDGSTVDRGRASVSLGGLAYTYGVSARLDASASLFGVSYRDDEESRGRGLGDLFVDLKWRFHGDGLGGLNLAYRPGLTVPVGQAEDHAQSPGLGFWTLNQGLVATLVRGRWSVGLEAGFLVPFGDRDATRGFVFAGGGAGYQVTPRIKPELELSYIRDILSGSVDAQMLAATAGVILNLTDALRLDGGLRRGLWGRNVDRSVEAILNLSLTFGDPSR